MSDQLAERLRSARLLDWITTTNHKTIGLLYIGSSLIFFLVSSGRISRGLAAGAVKG